MKVNHVDYLVLGGANHGEIYNGERRETLTLRSREAIRSLPPFCAPVSEAMTVIPPAVTYKVHEHQGLDGKRYLIATNQPLTDFDIDNEIRKAGIAPTD
ncbi:hypothetical protein F3I27_21885 [Pantoea sp. Bo_2]|uniref:Uncharacterized protein n=1 Tax=Candidatus Pantoea gossypiicola TaxID=2608008 RepID=A0AB34CD67_9GAMM|nr:MULTISPECIES: hypothetical protein [Pantoea]KAA5937589.1 hypothetical protein F3I57_21360 [Pantoea sp. VH_3]KAA5946720.1 hypothetical protein F3I56_22145 [Pantoea sp. VH_25]KAA5949540.1 hypothetical protein F3I55_22500 [Pantoea sp. VH_24]KAA5957713.1 hypothetical protein F3I53_15795 [Pantoea sp. VH_16]KAA5959154.1 hypothetical protein F3I54_22530 [Pantoea sp. VH_18]